MDLPNGLVIQFRGNKKFYDDIVQLKAMGDNRMTGVRGGSFVLFIDSVEDIARRNPRSVKDFTFEVVINPIFIDTISKMYMFKNARAKIIGIRQGGEIRPIPKIPRKPRVAKAAASAAAAAAGANNMAEGDDDEDDLGELLQGLSDLGVGAGAGAGFGAGAGAGFGAGAGAGAGFGAGAAADSSSASTAAVMAQLHETFDERAIREGREFREYIVPFMLEQCKDKSPEELDALLINLIGIGESDAADVVREILRRSGHPASPAYGGGRRKYQKSKKAKRKSKRHPKRKSKRNPKRKTRRS